MQPQDSNQQPPNDNDYDDTLNGKKVQNPLEAMRPGEKVICEIKRHPIGLLGVYVSMGLLILLIAIIGYALGPSMLPDVAKSQIYSYTSVALLIALIFCAFTVIIAHTVYWGNRWVVTSDSVTQIQQISVFNKQSSQLSMGNLEDITAEQNGILPHMFNYGILKAETAGERSKFKFLYCPNPTYYAQCILNAREEFEEQHYRNVPNQNNQNYSNQQ